MRPEQVDAIPTLIRNAPSGVIWTQEKHDGRVTKPPYTLHSDDEALLEKIRTAALAGRFNTLWCGDWSAAGYSSQSEADLALCSMLAFWTKHDSMRMDRLFHQSGLFRADEWDCPDSHGRTYGERTIEKACAKSMHPVDGYTQHTKTARIGMSSQVEEWEPENSTWPILDLLALPGFVGDFVELATADSEADPAAVLATLLCRFGAEVYGYEHGKGPCCHVGETKHFPRLFVAIVGATAKARKGTSAGPVRTLFQLSEVDRGDYSPAAVAGGPLSSGEGLVYCVRDERKEWQVVNRSGEGRWIIGDPGVADKRLFILDEELAAAMASLKREGCTLSAALRQIWDSGSYSPMTKRERTTCTDAHINIVTHTTHAELRAMLEEVQILNGFANRFLWVCSRRNKVIAEPKRMDREALTLLQQHLASLITQARQVTSMHRSEGAASLWREVYPDLSAEHPGVAGAVIARGEAHATRVSIIYALMDGESLIQERHLRAALAFWAYCRESALYLFPNNVQDQTSTQILALLRSGPLTGTDLYRALANHVTKAALTKTLDSLIASGKVICKSEPTSGRPRKTYALGN